MIAKVFNTYTFIASVNLPQPEEGGTPEKNEALLLVDSKMGDIKAIVRALVVSVSLGVFDRVDFQGWTADWKDHCGAEKERFRG
jgi:hypothetical protein